jgi:hypothetical protein
MFSSDTEFAGGATKTGIVENHEGHSSERLKSHRGIPSCARTT